MKKNIFILLILINTSIVFTNKSLFAKCFFQNCITSKKETDNFLHNTDHNYFLNNKLINILIKEDIQLNEIFEKIFISDQSISELNIEKAGYEIESDIQYSSSDVFFAEGNVKIFLSNGFLETDKISYDKKNKIFKIHNKFIFKSGEQFLEGDSLEYDFSKSTGSLQNVYGAVNLKSISQDLKFKNNFFQEENCPKKRTKIIDLPSEVELLDRSNLRFKSDLSFNPSLNLDFASINKWRFKSEKIVLDQDSWKSDLIYFTNDPFNKPQLLLKSKQFAGEIKQGKINLSSNSTILILDDKFNIPLGKRTIKDNVANFRWGVGYSEKEKDGLYILRKFDPIDLSEDFQLDLTSYFLIQRAIESESSAFRGDNTSLASDNITISNLDISDYFALSSKFSGSFSDWVINIDSDIKSLNPDRLYDSFSTELNLSKNLVKIKKPAENKSNSSCNYSDEDYPNRDYTLDFGLYGIYDKDYIHTAYGGKFISNLYESSDNKEKNYSLVLDLGDFHGKSKEDNKYLNLTRYGLTSSLSQNYKLFNFGRQKQSYTKDIRFSADNLDQGLFLNSRLSSGFYEYSNGKAQAIYSFELGPRIVYGNLRKNLFDYTEIKVLPEFVLKNGTSPLTFDDFNNDSRIKVELKQQLFGPLIMGFNTYFNINNSSSSYGEFTNKEYSIGVSRRAYSINLSYSELNESVLFGFEIFDFGYKNNSPSF